MTNWFELISTWFNVYVARRTHIGKIERSVRLDIIQPDCYENGLNILKLRFSYVSSGAADPFLPSVSQAFIYWPRLNNLWVVSELPSTWVSACSCQWCMINSFEHRMHWSPRKLENVRFCVFSSVFDAEVMQSIDICSWPSMAPGLTVRETWHTALFFFFFF